MKKVILFIRVFTIILFSGIGIKAIGQNPQYYNSWMFPEVVNPGCVTIPFSTNGINPNRVVFSNDVFINAYSQPYFTDSIISIKGIAILGSWGANPDTSYKFYLQIRDSSLNNVVAQVRYDTVHYSFSTTPPWSTGGNGFEELLFDSSIFINANKFYAVITLREENLPPFYFNTNIQGFGFLSDSCIVTENPKWFRNNKWEDIHNYITDEPYDGLSIFPILDTLTYQGQNDISVINSDVEINIYPNPAENEINFSSSIEITKIEILNLLGQIIYTKDIKSTNAKIDVSNLAKGNYIAKTYTKKGIKINKLIFQ